VRLPTAAEWEKAARGGLVDARYPWGNAPADRTRCDCNHFGEWTIAPSRSFAPNGYGLYAMAGGIAEWTADWYDALAYRRGGEPEPNPRLVERVLRGGSWADAPEACTVSFRASRAGGGWRDEAGRAGQLTPTVGFRLCRVAR
jgi:formylglycine-generating enzyme required for sulfatase activity